MGAGFLHKFMVGSRNGGGGTETPQHKEKKKKDLSWSTTMAEILAKATAIQLRLREWEEP